MATIADLAAQYDVTDRQIRNHLKLIADCYPGEALKVAGSRTELTDFAVEQIAELRRIGPTAYARQHAPEPIAPVTPETTQAPAPQPEPQPAAVHEMADRPDRELVGRTQAPVTGFALVPISSEPSNLTQSEAVPVEVAGVGNVIPFAPVQEQFRNQIQSGDYTLQAARQLIHVARERLLTGIDVADQQTDYYYAQAQELDLAEAELEAVNGLHRRAQVRASVAATYNDRELGKRQNRLAALAAANGFQLQPLSS